jgi:hypothetical protein
VGQHDEIELPAGYGVDGLHTFDRGDVRDFKDVALLTKIVGDKLAAVSAVVQYGCDGSTALAKKSGEVSFARSDLVFITSDAIVDGAGVPELMGMSGFEVLIAAVAGVEFCYFDVGET